MITNYSHEIGKNLKILLWVSLLPIAKTNDFMFPPKKQIYHDRRFERVKECTNAETDKIIFKITLSNDF